VGNIRNEPNLSRIFSPSERAVSRAARGILHREIEEVHDEASLSDSLKALIHNKVDLWKLSNHLRVNPSTIQKILDGRPISRSLAKKLASAIQSGGTGYESRMGSGFSQATRLSVERLVEVHHLYEAAGSLRAVGRVLCLSRERVRQLLKIGSEIGLFDYHPSRRAKDEGAPKEALIDRF